MSLIHKQLTVIIIADTFNELKNISYFHVSIYCIYNNDLEVHSYVENT